MASDRGLFRKIGINTISVLGGDVLNKAGIFFVYAALSRRVSLYEFGQMSLGLLLLHTFQVIAVAGLPVALTRAVARTPRSSQRLLRHGYLASFVPAALAVFSMCVLANAMQYERETIIVIMLLSIAIPAYALTMITEAVIRGRERMHLIAIGNVPGNLLLVGGSYAVLRLDYGVAAVACIVVASRVVTFAVMHLLCRFSLCDSRNSVLRPRLSWLLLRHSMLFFGTDGLQAISASLFALLLSKFATEREVGLLGASFQLMQPVQMVYRSVGHSLFPPLVAASRVSSVAVGDLARSILGLMVRLAFPAALAVFCLAGDLLGVIYGSDDFRESANVLQIMAFTLVLMPLNPVLGHGLWAMDHERSVFRIVVVNLLVRAIVGFTLIAQYGLVGGAYSVLVCSIVNTAQHYWYFDRQVSKLHFGRELIRIAPAALSAIACVVFLPTHRFFALMLALAIYAVLSLHSYGRTTMLRRGKGNEI